MAEIRPELKALLTVIGVNQQTLELLMASPFAIDALNNYASYMSGRVSFGQWVLDDGSVNSIVTPFIRVTSNAGASMHPDDPPWIEVSQTYIDRLTDSDPVRALAAAKTFASVLLHEMEHVVQWTGSASGYPNPMDYAFNRSFNEGDSGFVEYMFERDLLAARKITPEQLRDGLVPHYSIAAQEFSKDETSDRDIRRLIVDDIETLYASLTNSGTSAQEIRDTVTKRLGELNRQFSHPSTEPQLTYEQQDIRDFLAARLNLPMQAGSHHYLPPPSVAPTLLPDGTWSVTWDIPAVDGFPPSTWVIEGNKETFTATRYVTEAPPGAERVMLQRRTQSATLVGPGIGFIDQLETFRPRNASLPAQPSLSFGLETNAAGRSYVSRVLSVDGVALNMPGLDRVLKLMEVSATDAGRLQVARNADGSWSVSLGTDQRQLSASVSIDNDGSARAEWTDNGKRLAAAFDTAGALHSRSETVVESAYRTVTTSFGANGQVVGRVITQRALDGSYATTVYHPDGSATRTQFDTGGQAVGEETISSGSQALAGAVGQLANFLGFVQAIQSGKPLPMITSGINVAASVTGNSTLSGVSSGLGSLASLYNLNRALQQGDTLAAVTAGANALNLGLNAYTSLFSSTAGTTAVGQAISSLSTPISSSLPGGTPLAYLNLVNDIAHGNAVGMVADIAAIAFPPAAPFIMVAQIIYSLAQGEPEPWGQAKFVFDGAGGVTLQVLGGDGGDTMVRNQAQALLDGLNQYIATANTAGLNLGLIPQRLSGIGFKDGAWTLNRIDEVTGADRTIQYLDGRVIGVPIGSPEYFRGMGEQFLYDVVAREAVASKWEVDTAKLQTANGDPMAGLTELQRAQKIGKIARALPPGATDQSFRPVILDLNGDGIQTISRDASGVAFDVDDSGFLKHTAWAGATEGMLVIDRNSNGAVDSGSELFSNSKVDTSVRGLAGMSWLDAGQDGRIGIDDPVFSQLRVWTDANSDGIVQQGEAKSLTELGITSLNYRLGTFVRNGITLQMGSPDLTADTQGTNVHVVTGGIVVQSSNGQTSLIVSKVNDLGTAPGGGDPGGGDPGNPGGGDPGNPGGGDPTIAMGNDGISGPEIIEDRELQILVGDLLANDRINGDAGPQLTMIDVGSARHGTVSLVNGVVHFTPERDYFGGDAGFSYTARNAAGVTGQAQVVINLAPVNDAPVVHGQGNNLENLYGWGGRDDGDRYTDIAYPRFHPGLWRDSQYDNSRGYGWRDTPIVTGYPDPFNGKLQVTDVDDSSFTFRIKNQGQLGVASIDAQGNWHYEVNNPQGIDDVFRVEIIDAHGGVTTQDITVAVPAVFLDVGAPIVLDLDGNGASLTSLAASQAFYDMKGDGLRHRTGWVAGADGLLAYDANGDGEIAGQKELSFKGYKAGAQTDLEGLAAFDTDGDGKLSAGDIGWSRFKVWRDLNGDGVSQAGELVSLDAAGIATISLQSDHQFATQEGNTVHGKSALTFTDGRQSAAYDVAFAVSDDVQIVRADGSVEVVSRPPNSSGADVVGTEVGDTLIGHVGNDTLRGLGGDDFIFDDEGKDVVEAGDGNDTVMTGIDDDVVMAGTGNDVVMAGAGNDLVFGEDGDDALLGEDGNDILFGGAGNDLVSGGVGNDVLSGNDGDDVITGEQGNDALFGGNGADQLMGNEGDDRLQGDDGDDLLDGGSGNDLMIGGAGNDRYVVDAAGDVITEVAGEGWDQVDSYAEAYTLGDAVEELTLKGGALRGTGNALDNVLTGNALANTLDGGAGADVLDGGLGADRLIGGAGNDTYLVDNAGDVVVEQWGGGIDTVKASVDHTLADEVENLVLTGVGALAGTGNALDNHLTGNAAANRLDGGFGADTLEGGLGDDTYVVDQTGDRVIERAGEGTDTVEAGIEYTLGDNVENLTLTGWATRGAGNALDNTLRANDNGNTLLGGGGADLLIGGKGRDTLDGGTGADILRGGQGGDTYVVDNAGDVVDEMANGDPVLIRAIRAVKNQISWVQGSGALVDAMVDYIAAHPDETLDVPTLAARFEQMEGSWIIGWNLDLFAPLLTLDYTRGSRLDGGKDTVVASFDYTLGASVENLTLAGDALAGTGNALDNRLVGNAGNNVLDGRSGADFMVGGEGDDLYFVDNAGDRVLEADAFDKPWSYGLRDMTQIFKSAVSEDWWPALIDDRMSQVEALLTEAYDQGTTNIWATNVPSILMEFYSANYASLLDEPLPPFSDFLSMTWSDPRLSGGHDVVRASVSYVADAGVEDVLLTGEAIAATGNLLDNRLTGNDQDNLLDGGAGNDTLIGGRGNDTLQGGDGDDFFEWKDGDGLDAISDLSGLDVLSLGAGLTADSFDYVTEEVDGRQRTTLIRIDAQGQANGEGVRLNGSAATGFEIEEIRLADGTSRSVEQLLAAIDERKQPADGGEDYVGTDGDDTFLLADAKRGVVNRYHGKAGTDTILGTWGYDYLQVSSTLSSLDSIEVLDGVNGDFKTNFILGTDGADRWDFSGKTVRNFLIAPGAGDDLVIGTAGNDLIEGGMGADQVFGGGGDDSFLLTRGDLSMDVYDGGTGTNTIRDDWGYDVLRVQSGLANLRNIQVIEGVDREPDVNRIVASDDADVLDFSAMTVRNFTIDAGGGDDVVVGTSGNDRIRGGAGDDHLSGGAGDDVFLLNGGDQDGLDQFDGGSGVNTIQGTWGTDVLRVENHLANLRGIQVLDGLNAAGEGDRLSASSDDDTLDFSAMTVRGFILDGGAGNDDITGTAGNDMFRGGAGDDELKGGAGDDTYLWSYGDGQDHIRDTAGANLIRLDGVVRSSVSAEATQDGFALRIGASVLTIDSVAGASMQVRIGSTTYALEDLVASQPQMRSQDVRQNRASAWAAADAGALGQEAGWHDPSQAQMLALADSHATTGLVAVELRRNQLTR